MSEGSLAGLARMRIQAGALPPREPTALFAGFGSGAPCAVCDLPINDYDVEYEVELGAHPARVWSMHLECFHAWRQACGERG